MDHRAGRRTAALVNAAGAWLARRALDGAPRVRVLAFPYAGGGTACFAGWARAMESRRIEFIPVKLPGREQRLAEPPLSDMGPIVEAVASAAAAMDDRPLALFGHSMGALIAFEVARVLTAAGAAPAHLFVSAARAPHVPPTSPPIHHLPDDEFLDAVDRRYGGIPQEVRHYPELKAIVVPPLRADLTIVEQYRYRDGGSLSCDVLAFSGRHDALIDPAHVVRWREITTGRFESRVLDGDHFFLRPSAPSILDAIADAIVRP